MPLADFRVGQVMGRCYLDDAGAELRVNRFIGNNKHFNFFKPGRFIGGNIIIHAFNFQFFTDIFFVALVARVNSQSSITEFCFGASGGQRERPVFYVIKFCFFRNVIHFKIGNRGCATHAPIYHSFSLVYPALFVVMSECFVDGFNVILVHSESGS